MGYFELIVCPECHHLDESNGSDYYISKLKCVKCGTIFFVKRAVIEDPVRGQLEVFQTAIEEDGLSKGDNNVVVHSFHDIGARR
jgi:Zn ribbon nucleic-acid-binding protein